MEEAIKKSLFDLYDVPKELFANREFVLSVLKIIKNSQEEAQEKELAIMSIKYHLDPLLKNDDEINQYLAQNN